MKIDIETPFFLQTDRKLVKYDLLIKSFGSKKGTVFITTDDMSEFEFDTAQMFGFYCSALNPCCYNKYNKEHFIDTLTDWGYFGRSQSKPNWYTGHIYESVKLKTFLGKTFSKNRIMQNRSEPCIGDKYPCQSGTDRQK